MSDNTRKDMIKNKCICQKLEVAPTLMKDNVGWFGCVQWRSMHEWYGGIIWSKLKVLKSLEGVEIKCGLYPSFSVRYLLFACTCYWPTKKIKLYVFPIELGRLLWLKKGAKWTSKF